jgi:hypothetical protein
VAPPGFSGDVEGTYEGGGPRQRFLGSRLGLGRSVSARRRQVARSQATAGIFGQEVIEGYYILGEGS